MSQSLAQPVLFHNASKTNSVGLKVGIVVARHDMQCVGTLFSRAYEVLIQYGIAADNIQVVSIPRAYDITKTAQNMLARDAYHAVICLSCFTQDTWNRTIPFSPRGTDSNKSVQWVAFYRGIPMTFGMIDLESQQPEAIVECGAQCARTAIAMANKMR